MKYRHTKGLEIQGNVDIIVVNKEDDFEGEKETWQEVLIHRDPEGLRSLVTQLNYLADLEQEKVEDKYLPVGAREHMHLRPNLELSKSSNETIIGRLDSKVDKDFYQRFIAKDD